MKQQTSDPIEDALKRLGVTGGKTPQDKTKAKILAQLEALGGTVIGDDDIQFTGTAFVIPEMLQGNLMNAARVLARIAADQDEEYEFTRVYDYRPYDGAAAFDRALRRVFGTTGVGKATYSFFGGKQPPEYITVATGPDDTIEVPWGQVEITELHATFSLDAGRGKDPADGPLFRLSVTAPKKYRKHLAGVFEAVQDELEQRSIYRGMAIDGAEHPGFLNPFSVDPERVVYSEIAETQLTANVWTAIQHAQLLMSMRVPLKRAFLLEGPYGSGKTLAALLTAQRAVDNGWTFIQVRVGDDPYAALRTAKLYSPSVVWVEDIDRLTAEKTRDEISRLLDALDNVQSKGAAVMAGFSTNFPDAIDAGMLRPGRIDAVIHIGALDRQRYEKLVRVTAPEGMLAPDVDFDKVVGAFTNIPDLPDEQFLPAFVVEAAQRAIRYAVAETGGRPETITTQNLVDAAVGLYPQLILMANAHEAEHARFTIDRAMKDMVTDVVSRTEIEEGPPLVVKEKHLNGVAPN